ncbi:MAG TPA: toxin [Candidatus Levybacteria bacterium]|nr:toxin [Candidatus Levybacteria bacterium]
MAFSIRFNEEKNQLLKATRGISFENIINSIEKKEVLDSIAHPSKKYPHQRLYVIKIKGYIYAVPYIINREKQEIFLKTIYPSRLLTKKYLTRLPKPGTGGQEGGKNEKK